MTLAYVGLGSNLDRPVEHVARAFGELAGIRNTRLLRRSSLYRSAPVGYTDQPQFINAVAELDSRLAAAELLEELHGIEDRHGRSRSFPDAPRTLDLDLLLYGNEVMGSPRLTIPHPRMHCRAFVLEPLLEIAPDIVIPGLGPASAHLPGCAGQRLERIA